MGVTTEVLGRDSAPRIQVAALTEFCLAAMHRSGIGDEDARLTAEVLVTTDTWGVFTHGTRQLRGLMKNVRLGAVNPTTKPGVSGEGPSWALVDAHSAMPPAVAYRLPADVRASLCGLAADVGLDPMQFSISL